MPTLRAPTITPGDRIIQPDEVVLCDFGGTTAEPHGEPGLLLRHHSLRLHRQAPGPRVRRGLRAAPAGPGRGRLQRAVGTPAEAVDGVARDRLADADLAQYFIHRIGHGIGVEAHEDPYLVEGNDEPLRDGNAFSIEPGFYVPGRWGARLEDIVVATVRRTRDR